MLDSVIEISVVINLRCIAQSTMGSIIQPEPSQQTEGPKEVHVQNEELRTNDTSFNFYGPQWSRGSTVVQYFTPIGEGLYASLICHEKNLSNSQNLMKVK